MSTPLVSVIIPTYNRAALLCEAIDTVLAQSYQNTEIIVIDDGSTDDTTAAVQQYGDRIRYTRRPNAGVNAARNLGIKQARGEYLALLDSDDLWAPHKLELQVALLRYFNDVGFTFSNFMIFRGPSPEADVLPTMDGLATWLDHVPGRIEPYRWQRSFAAIKGMPALQLPTQEFTVSGGDIYASSLVCPYVLPSASLIRKSSLGQLRLPEIQATCGDWEFFARFSKQSGCVYADLPTTYNRSHEDEVRLTRGDPGVRLGRRISMIDRVWRADREFYVKLGDKVDEVQRALLLQAARRDLFSARRGQARAHLKRAASIETDRKSIMESVLRLLANIPGSGWSLRGMRATLNGARQLAARVSQQ
ncbi:MAG TPA: glycosyltransferase family A protein [Steroidobacter sp.]|nr:glycosyltransferase family A protein [Steroidobacter sp.]